MTATDMVWLENFWQVAAASGFAGLFVGLLLGAWLAR